MQTGYQTGLMVLEEKKKATHAKYIKARKEFEGARRELDSICSIQQGIFPLLWIIPFW